MQFLLVFVPMAIITIIIYAKQKLIDLFEKNGININLRAETMSVDEILKLYQLIVSNQ